MARAMNTATAANIRANIFHSVVLPVVVGWIKEYEVKRSPGWWKPYLKHVKFLIAGIPPAV
jgi:hypothetical protein